MIQEILQMEKFAKENGLQLSGHVLGVVKRALTGKEEIVIDQHNTIYTDLKEQMRDTMHSNVDFALDNLLAAQVAVGALSATQNGKDGLFIFDGVTIMANALAFMASAVHPTDPSGNYYRQWQGVYQNLTAGTLLPDQASMGQNYQHGLGSPWTGGVQYATAEFSEVTLLVNDIITINWKITIG